MRDDVKLLKESALVQPGTVIRGGIYDVTTGKVAWLE